MKLIETLLDFRFRVAMASVPGSLQLSAVRPWVSRRELARVRWKAGGVVLASQLYFDGYLLDTWMLGSNL